MTNVIQLAPSQITKRPPKWAQRARSSLPFPLDVPALILKTEATLTDKERYALILLFASMWRQVDCAVPDDTRILARCAGVSPTLWKRHYAASILPLLERHRSGGWTHESVLASARKVEAELRKDAAEYDRALAEEALETLKEKESET